MSDFPSVLKARIDEKGLSAADAATTIGVSAPSLRGALAGQSFPNARSLNKYAEFLGKSAEETKALIASAKPAPGSKPRKGGKPGRKPGRKPGSGKAEKPAGKPGRKSGSASAALATIAAALKDAESLANDPLAVAVNKLGAGQRRLIEGILKSIG